MAISWISNSDGFWDDGDNWSSGTPPTSSDDVTLDVAADVTVTVRNSERVRSIEGNESIVIASGGTLRVDTASTYDGPIEIDGGTLNVIGELTAQGGILWSAGTVNLSSANLVLPSGSTSHITAPLDVALNGGRSIELEGTLIHSGGGNMLAASSATIMVQPDGVYELASDADVTGGTVVNAGTVRKSGGNGESQFGLTPGAVLFQHFGGTVEVVSGKLTLNRSFSSTTGTGGHFEVAEGTTLDLTGGHTATLTGLYTGSGQGRVEVASGGITTSGSGLTFEFEPGVLHWTGGLISAASARPLINAGAMTLSGDGDRTHTGEWINLGSVVLTDAGTLGGGTIDNRSEAVWDFQGDASLTSGTFVNAGLVRKSGGDGESRFGLTPGAALFQHLGGTVEVQSGKLTLNRSFSNTTGTGAHLDVAEGAVLDLTGGHTATLTGDYTASGAGRVVLASGTIATADEGARFDMPLGVFHFTGGTISSTAARPFTVGTSMTVSALGDKLLNGVLINEGTVIHVDDGTFASGGSGVVVNAAGSVWDLQGDGGLRRIDFTNAGTLRKSAGEGTSVLEATASKFNNLGGRVEIETGRFVVQSAGDSTGGHFHVSAGAVLEFATPLQKTLAGTYTGEGLGRVELTGRMTGSNDDPARLDFPQGMFHWVGADAGNSFGALVNDGFITLTGSGQQALRGRIVNFGTIVHRGEGAFRLAQGSILDNLGVFDFQGDGHVELFNFFDGPSGTNVGADFNNLGVLRKSDGLGTSRIFSDLASNSRLNNLGIVEVVSGTLQIDTKVAQLADQTLHAGTWSVEDFATLHFVPGGDILTSHATVILDGPASSFPNISALEVNGGSLQLLGGREFSTAGDFVNGIERVELEVGHVKTETGASSFALAFEPATNRLFAYGRRNDFIQKFDLNGAEVLPRIDVPGGESDWFGMDFAKTALNVGGTNVPAGTLLVVNGGSQPVTLYAVNGDNGDIVASVEIPITRGNGVAHHPDRGTLFVANYAASNLVEVDPATGEVLSTLPVQPAGAPSLFKTSPYEIAVDFKSGNLLVATDDFSVGAATKRNAKLRELAPTGEFVRDLDLEIYGIATMTGMSSDPETGDLWIGQATSRGAWRLAQSELRTIGELTVGVGSTLTVHGQYTENASDTLRIQIGGRPDSGDFGRLNVSGTAHLLGRMHVQLADGFGPTLGDVYQVMTYAQREGQFVQVTGLEPFFGINVGTTSIELNGQLSGADLAVESIAAPATAEPGQSVTIEYTVENRSNVPLTGNWVDSIYLSSDGVFDPSDRLIGRVEHVGGLSALGSYTESLIAALPGVVDGQYQVIVIADSRGIVPDTNRQNNRRASTSEVAVNIAHLPFDTPLGGSLDQGEGRYFRIDVPPGGDVRIAATFQQAWQADVLLAQGRLPTRSDFDLAAPAPTALERGILLPSPDAGTYYLLLHGREGAQAGEAFEVLVEHIDFQLSDVSPAHGSNTGQATSLLRGAGFAPDMVVELVDDSGVPVVAASTTFASGNEIFATFDLGGVAPGFYGVRASRDARAETLDGAFEVVVGEQGRVQVELTAPGSVRAGRSYTGHVVYTNTGDTDAVVPLITIESTLQFTFDLTATPSTQFARVLGISPLGPAGILAPDQSVSLPFRFRGGTGTIEVKSQHAGMTAPMDWEALREGIRPLDHADDWDDAFDERFVAFGTTVGDYVRLLAEGATLYQLRTGQTTANPNTLNGFLMAEQLADRNATLRGFLHLDSLNRPAAGIVVTAIHRDTGEAYGTVARADGLVRIQNAPPGTYDVSFQEVVPPSTAVVVEVPDDGTAEFTALVRSGGSITGRVGVPDGVSLIDESIGYLATVFAVDAAGNRFEAGVDENRLYQFRGLPAGSYELFFNTPATLPVSVAGIEVTDGQTTGLIDLFSPLGGSVRGFVRDLDTGDPIEGIGVSILADTDNPRLAVSDSDGAFLLTGLTPGTATLFTQSNDLPSTSITNVLVIAGQITDVEVRIDTNLHGAVVGQVTFQDNPVADASVDLLQNDESILTTATDSLGQYTIGNIPPGDYQLVVDGFGFAVSRQDITIDVGEEKELDVELQQTGIVTATVTAVGVDGPFALPHAPLVLVDPDGNIYSLEADEDGTFAISRLEPGEYQLMLADGSHRQSFEIASATQDLDLSFQMTTGSLIGRVLDPDGAVPLQGVIAKLVAGDQVVATEFTAADGYFAFPMVAPGTYDLVFESIEHDFPRVGGATVSAGTFIDVGEVIPGSATLDVTIGELATLASPASGGLLSLLALDQPDLPPRFLPFDETGQLTIAGLVPGRYHVVTSAEGFAVTQSTVEVTGSGDALTVSLVPGGELRGTITDPAGAPLDGISVVAFDPANRDLLWETLTDEEGHYEFHLPDGTYTVIVSDLRDDIAPEERLTHSEITGITIVEGGLLEQDVQLAAGTATLAGTVNGSQGDAVHTPPLGAVVLVQTLDGVPVAVALADANGEFTLEHLTPGEYQIVVLSPGFAYPLQDVTIEAGANAFDPGGTWVVPSAGLIENLAPRGAAEPDGIVDGVVPGSDDFAVAPSSLFGPADPALAVDLQINSRAVQALLAKGRKFIAEFLKEPKETPDLRRPQIPDDCPEALRQWRRVMELQRAAHGFFEGWRMRWSASVEKAASNLGLFGVSLLEFAGTLLGNAKFFSSKVGELKAAEIAIHRTRGPGTAAQMPALQAELRSIQQQLQSAEAMFQSLAKQKQIVLNSTGVATSVVGNTLTAIQVPTTVKDIGDAFNQVLGSTNATEFFSNLRNVGSVIGQFAIDLAKISGAISSSVTTIASLFGTDLLVNAPPGLQKFLANLGPALNVIDLVVKATRGITDGLSDLKDLKDNEERYESTIRKRNAAFLVLIDILKECKDDDEEDDDEPEEPKDPDDIIAMFSVASFDPNDIIGPAGTGAPDHFMRPEQTFYYTVLFENLPSATAPAQEVVITHPLDANLDFTTFEVGSFGWDEFVFLVPPGRSFYETRIDMTETLGFFVDFSAGIDVETGIATWSFVSIDPLTGDLISDALAGFLPPNATSPEGEGFVEFSVRPRDGTGTGDAISAQASIVFDTNDPIVTPIYLNRLDNTPPTSSVELLPAVLHAETFTLRWSGDDGAGSGIERFDVFVSIDGGPFEPLLLGTAETSTNFAGEFGKTYRFYSVATDAVGFREATPSMHDAETQLLEGDPTPDTSRDTLALFEHTNSLFFYSNALAAGPAEALAQFGPSGNDWIPLAGDWNASGADSFGFYAPSGGLFFLMDEIGTGPADTVVQFGPVGAGWIPLVGDWNGDGRSTIGMYEPTNSVFFLANSNAPGPADIVFQFGAADSGWTPVVGDWDGDGVDTIGFYSGSTFFLKNSFEPGPADITFAYGPEGAGWIPLAGDWNNDNVDTVALFEPSNSVFFVNDAHQAGPATEVVPFGPAGAGWTPLAGNWNGTPAPNTLVAAATAESSSDASPLTDDVLATVVDAGLARWNAPGLESAGMNRLATVAFEIADLGGALLGLHTPGRVVIDDDAAGHGWFLALGDEAFLATDAEEYWLADPTGEAAEKYDLLTVVLHELGHELGLSDVDNHGGLMHSALEPGVRILPSPDVVDAVWASDA